MPFAFHITLPVDAQTLGAPTRIAIAKSIEEDVLSHPSHAFTPEDVFVIHCSPQAVFKVRPATRCSSTLSGMYLIMFLCYAGDLFPLSTEPRKASRIHVKVSQWHNVMVGNYEHRL